MKIARTVLLALAFAGSSTMAFADSKPKAPKKEEKKEKSLYDRLGGEKAIAAVIKDFLANVVADKRINKFFAKSDAKKLEKLLNEQVCEATGGPCKYSGKDMKEAHKGMKISDANFTALVEDLTKALNKHKVPKKEKDELLTALAGLKGDIVEGKPAKKK